MIKVINAFLPLVRASAAASGSARVLTLNTGIADVDFTLKVEATGLKPDTRYWFQFADCTNPKTVSPIGATRTLSSPNSKTLAAIAHWMGTDRITSQPRPARSTEGSL